MQNIFLRLFVTLRMEGVDRNRGGDRMNTYHPMVTLRMEGVDRNVMVAPQSAHISPSPSAWRVWIEICSLRSGRSLRRVTLRMEGVDRNDEGAAEGKTQRGHPPHGGCG